MPNRSIYITDAQYLAVLDALDIAYVDSQGVDLLDKFEILDRAVGDMEADLCERFIVPLQTDGSGDFSTAPAYAQNKILNTIKSKIRQIIGADKNRNLVIDNTQRYIDLHQREYKEHITTLLDPKKLFGLALQSQAQGAVVPTQTVGLARANNRFRAVPDRDGLF